MPFSASNLTRCSFGMKGSLSKQSKVKISKYCSRSITYINFIRDLREYLIVPGLERDQIIGLQSLVRVFDLRQKAIIADVQRDSAELGEPARKLCDARAQSVLLVQHFLVVRNERVPIVRSEIHVLEVSSDRHELNVVPR